MTDDCYRFPFKAYSIVILSSNKQSLKLHEYRVTLNTLDVYSRYPSAITTELLRTKQIIGLNPSSIFPSFLMLPVNSTYAVVISCKKIVEISLNESDTSPSQVN